MFMATNTMTRIAVPMPKSYIKDLKYICEERGFDSIQAMFRYMSKGLIDGRFTFGDYEEFSPEHIAGFEKTYIDSKRANEFVGPFNSTEDLLASLRN